jgi:hypothetical protein
MHARTRLRKDKDLYQKLHDRIQEINMKEKMLPQSRRELIY